MAEILDIVALRSLAAIADAGGFRRAAESLHLSQSAVSQHVRRLEQTCGAPLVQREGNGTRFTAAGELLVAEARKILAAHDDALERVRPTATAQKAFVIGSTEHSADLLLPAITAALRNTFPEHAVRFRIDRGQQLSDRLNEGRLDASLFIGDVRGHDALPAGALPLAWYAAPGWQISVHRTGAVPLIVIDEPCTIRRRAVGALLDNDMAATIVCEAGHLAGVINAARAGVGVALLAHIGNAPEGLEELYDLPPVADEPLHVRGRAAAPDALLVAIAAGATAVTTVGEPP